MLLIPNVWGSSSANQVLTLNCDRMTFETCPSLPFDFTSGACSTNDNHIVLCFSKQSKKRCYKSMSPIPEHWWQFTLTRMSSFRHKSISISISAGKSNPSNIS